MESTKVTSALKSGLKALFRQTLEARELAYMWTHLLPSSKGIYDRWIAVPDKDGGGQGKWDVYFQRYKVLPRTINACGDKQLVAAGLSAPDAMRLLEQRESNHPGLKHVARMDRLWPTSNHYSRAGGVVEDMAQRVSAAGMARMRQKGARPKRSAAWLTR